MNKKAINFLTPGLVIRLVAAVIDVVSLPFLITNPSNIFAIISFALGNFLLVIGGLID